MYINEPTQEIGVMAGKLGMLQRQTLRERLQEQKKALEFQLASLSDAIKFMDDNPNFENFHNVITKAGF